MTRHRRRNPTRTQNPQPEPCPNTWTKCATFAVYAGKSRAESAPLDTRETQSSPGEVTKAPQSESASANSTRRPAPASGRPDRPHASPSLFISKALEDIPEQEPTFLGHFASRSPHPSHKQSECDTHHEYHNRSSEHTPHPPHLIVTSTTRTPCAAGVAAARGARSGTPAGSQNSARGEGCWPGGAGGRQPGGPAGGVAESLLDAPADEGPALARRCTDGAVLAALRGRRRTNDRRPRPEPGLGRGGAA